LFVEDPENAEYVELKTTTLELISDLQKLLHAPLSPPKPTLNSGNSASLEIEKSISENNTSVIEGPKLENQVEEALKRGLYVGLPSEAIWPEDGLWYPATIESIKDEGVRVKFKSYGDVLMLEAKAVRASSLLEKKRKEPSGGSEEPEHVDSGIPEHIRFADTDTDKTREWKKRQQKAWKAEKRREKQEIAENKAKMSWQNFNKNLKKTGSTAPKKESMFRTTDIVGGKIGVIGSGKSMTKQTASSSASLPRHSPSPSSFASPQQPPPPHYDPLAAPSYYIPQTQPPPPYAPHPYR
jgi:survival-of-motor-neuron-related-splicing factor 30